MPCYESREESSSRERSLEEELKATAACLCAVINELEKLGIEHQVLTDASRHGLIDLMSFWEKHKKSDKARVARRLHSFSIHEQGIIKGLLDKKTDNDK